MTFVNPETGEVVESHSSLLSKLLEIQHTLKCDKSQYNKFGGFNYRSKEDILEAVKPLAYEQGCAVLVDDMVEEVNGKAYIKSVASLIEVDTGHSISASGLSREAETKKGMDDSQITGTSSSYAGKRALGNLFALDDTKDADDLEPMQRDKPVPQGVDFVGRCNTCGKQYTFPAGYTMEQLRATQCCARPDWKVC